MGVVIYQYTAVTEKKNLLFNTKNLSSNLCKIPPKFRKTGEWYFIPTEGPILASKFHKLLY